MQTELVAEEAQKAELFVTDEAQFFVDDHDANGFYATNTETHEQEYFEYFLVLDHEYFTTMQ